MPVLGLKGLNNINDNEVYLSLAISAGIQQQLPEVSADSFGNAEFYANFLQAAEKIQRNPKLRAEWEMNVKRVEKLEIEAEIPEFKCDVSEKSETRPTNVNFLRPSDIDVIAALGDSISAGNGLGARTLVEVAIPNRGEVFSIGGDKTFEEGVVTLPNILRKFNPLLKGYSICAGNEEDEFKSWLNVAHPGDTNDDMLDQAIYLVNRMKLDPKINFTDDWKLVTMFVGGNDLCRSCFRNHTGDAYYAWFESALEHFSHHMPRTVVNLVSMFDVTPLQNMSTGLACDLLQWGFCECARNWTTLAELRDLQLNYSHALEALANDERYNREDFTVIHQPHMRDMVPPIDPATGKYIIGFLSPDCFHPTRITHQAMASWLWNGLLTPVQHKQTTVDTSVTTVPLICPDKERPFIFTRNNSAGVSWPPPTEPPVISEASILTILQPLLYIAILIGSMIIHF